MVKTYQHLTYGIRYQISALAKRGGISQRGIAKELGCNQSTVSRELRRNSTENEYRPEEAHEKAVLRRQEASSVNKKLTPEIALFIEAKLMEQWSPEQISGRMKEMFGIKISFKRIYQYIHEDQKNGGTLYNNLRRRGKKYIKRKGKTAGRGVIPNRIGIEKRPEIVDSKIRVGDFEIDTIVGARHRGAMLSIVDIKTKFTFLVLLSQGTAEKVRDATIEALKSLEEHVHTITSDNGKEFSQHQDIVKGLNDNGSQVLFFFAHPYCSWERGLNENTNGLVRQYFPKKTDFTLLAQEDVNRVQRLLNTRPRKALKYLTPEEALFNETGKFIAPFGAKEKIQKVAIQFQAFPHQPVAQCLLI